MKELKSIIEWVEIKEENDLPPQGEFLVKYADGFIAFREWIPKTILHDWGWYDRYGHICLPPRYYCKLKDIKDYEF